MGIINDIFSRLLKKDPQEKNIEPAIPSSDQLSVASLKTNNTPDMPKRSCTNCGAMILHSTFAANKGLCAPCSKGPDIAERRHLRKSLQESNNNFELDTQNETVVVRPLDVLTDESSSPNPDELFDAVAKKDFPRCTLLLQQGAAVNAKQKGGLTPLHLAAIRCDLSIAIILLQKGAEINACKDDDWTPLHHSCQNGDVDVTHLLLKSDANPNAISKDGLTPLHVAAVGISENTIATLKSELSVTGKGPRCIDHEEVTRLLIASGADVNARKAGDGSTPLIFAAYKNCSAVVKAILNNGANINSASSDGWTALHIAAGNANESLIHLLVQHGAGIEAMTNDGRRPRDVIGVLTKGIDSTTRNCIEQLLCPQVTTNQKPATNKTQPYILLRNAVGLKEEATKWIRAQDIPLGTLMWFTLPCGINKYYQPCFGILADSLLFSKLERAESFNVAFEPIGSTFIWKILVIDPDQRTNCLTLATVPLPLDEGALFKLHFLSDQVRVHYLFYSSNQASNFVWMEMRPEFNQRLGSICHTLANDDHRVTNIQSREQEIQLQLHVSESSIEFADGSVIALSDIMEISAPEFVVSHQNQILTKYIDDELKKGRSIVTILYISKDGPITKIIPTVSHTAAVALADRIKDARASAIRKTSERAIVGECIACHRKLRVKAHAVKPKMILTCKCGQQNSIRVEADPSIEN